ncbi:2728_t:CDS:10 [Diversispora eburnea]|uniref:2728_t:CDS:1 n=1 Tax=Diversispora eburnea TaxID=1213867 RepID=A0A9N9FH02_9GLOM|nr:2728_t:CDS:10 [Diversispora eburnea]
MVKVKSPGLESFRLIVKDNNDSSKSQLNGSNNSNQQQQQFSRDNSSLSNDNISLKKENSTISLQDDDDYNILTQRIPSKEITFAKLSNQDESSQETQPTLRRSTRSRRVVFQQDYVPTVDVVPLRGDIPMRGDELTSTTPSSINTANLFPKRTYQFSLASLLREKKHRDKTGYDIKVLEKALKEDAIKDEMLNELDDPYENYENYNRSEVSAAILTEDIKHEQLQQSSPQLPQFPYISNLRLLLKTIVQLNKARWISFSNNEEIRRAIVVFLRMSSDNRIKSLSYEVEQVVDSLLYLIQKDEWVLQVKLICEDIILSCGNVTQFKIDILENLPASNRGRLTRRLLSACFLFSSTSSITSKKSFYDFTNLDVSKPLTLMPLINLFKDGETIFKVNSNTDYKELYKNTLLLGYILDDEEQMSSEKDTVEFIIQKLKYLHGKGSNSATLYASLLRDFSSSG